MEYIILQCIVTKKYSTDYKYLLTCFRLNKRWNAESRFVGNNVLTPCQRQDLYTVTYKFKPKISMYIQRNMIICIEKCLEINSKKILTFLKITAKDVFNYSCKYYRKIEVIKWLCENNMIDCKDIMFHGRLCGYTFPLKELPGCFFKYHKHKLIVEYLMSKYNLLQRYMESYDGSVGMELYV
jgi:hypothetical protein